VSLATRQSAQFVADLRQIVSNQLPASLRDHLAAVALRPDGLVLFMDGAVWASHMKLLLPEWRPDLSPHVAAGLPVSVRVLPGGLLRR
jgi:hypothetical protein